MNKHYSLISEVKLPIRDGDEHVTTIRIYHIDEEAYDFLCCVKYYLRDDGTYGPHNPAPEEVREAGSVENAILDDLGLMDDSWAAPGALYHTYDAMLWHGVVMVADTVQYNV